MSKDKKIKKGILIGSLIILLGGLAVFAYSILYNGGVVLKKTASIEVMNKLKDIHRQGGKVELTQNDINELSNLLLSSKDKLVFSNGQITYAPENFKIYKLKLLKK